MTKSVLAGLGALHERWFVPYQDLPTRWGDLVEAGPAAAIGAAVLVAAVVTLLWRWRGRPALPGPLALGTTPERLAVLMGWVPLMLGLHTAVPLFVSGVRGELFVPNLRMGLPFSVFVGVAEVGIGLLLFYGFLTRVAAVGIAVLWGVGVLLFGPVLLLEHTVFLGLAAFFYIATRGPVAVDWVLGPRAGAKDAWLPRAVPLLRIGAGTSIAWLALTEKLVNLPLALRFLEEYPWVNFLPALGLPVSDSAFLLTAGAVELAAGLLLVTGAFPRLVILFLWLPFNLTLTAFGWQELVGHLPIYAIMAVVLLWGPGGDEDVEALRAGLIPEREKPMRKATGSSRPAEGGAG